MVRVNLEVADETKHRWEQAAADSKEAAGNLSAFIRLGVEREIAGGHEPGGGGGGGGDATADLGQRIGTVIDRLDTLADQVDGMDTRVRTIERSTTPAPRTDDLTTAVFQLLPDAEPGSEGWQRHHETLRYEHGPDDPHTVAWTGTVPAIAAAMGESPAVVRDAIDTLRHDTHLVHTTDPDPATGEPRYHKEV